MRDDFYKFCKKQLFHQFALDMENYRQISVPSKISKLFEIIIYTKIIPFIETNNILTAQQGFRAIKLTETAT